jgi:predicted nicotinamide N-methyase
LTDFATAARFIQANTAIASPPACPEIKMWLATEITPMWEATEQVLQQANVDPPYWAFCWAGGQALTRWLLDHPEMVAGKRVLDFAAGCGVSALGAALRGASQVEAAEIDPMAGHAITLNARLNGVEVGVLIEDVVGQPCRWDVVVAGDVCYEAPMTRHIWPWLVSLAAQGALVVMADPGRAYLPRTGLLKVASYTVQTSLELEDRTEREVAIFKIVG